MGVEMANALPYIGMVFIQFAQVGLMVAGKVAMANGMTTFAFIFYSNIMASFILLPICLSIYRSDHPPLFPTFLCGFFLLGLIGFIVQALGYAGLLLTTASLSTTILNLIPGFTFVFAVILRMEKFKLRSSSTVAKCIGTLVTIMGAVVATLYQGPSLLGATSSSSSPWLIGGLLLILDSMVAAIFIITQAVAVRRWPAEMLLMLFYSCSVAILSGAASLIFEKDLNSWSLNSSMKFIPVLYSGLFGNVFQVTVIMWCVKRKGPLFASIFHPLGVIISIWAGIIILGETFYLGSLVGAVVVVLGFYAVLWGKAREAKTSNEEEEEEERKRVPLLHNYTVTHQDGDAQPQLLP